MKPKQITPSVAYFSMEIALDPNLPTYSGGLGILAGDTLRSAADLAAPLVAVTLVYRKGYFRQALDKNGNQSEEPQIYQPENTLKEMKERISVRIEGREVWIRGWLYTIQGVTGAALPVYLLDTDLPENSAFDRTITDSLYGGDEYYRFCQELVLGFGGFKLLQKLGYNSIQSYHMNEGHSALLALRLLEKRLDQSFAGRIKKLDIDGIRKMCIFTTHTPVPAGHDQFPRKLAEQILAPEHISVLDESEAWHGDFLNMTYLALRFSGYVNGVAMRHGEVSRGMFPNYPISAITNGVHAVTWTAQPFKELFDQFIPGWRTDNNYLRYAISIPLKEIRQTHEQARQNLFNAIQERTGIGLDPKILTIGFARRASTYKRADLLFSDRERLRKIAREAGPLQIVYAGKAHPRDEGGKALIRKVFEGAAAIADAVRTVYVENYDMHWGGLITSGVDLWLNTPLRPQEASGTSGMKAAVNGVLNLSVLDGWWIEACVEGVTGWSIGNEDEASSAENHADRLYDKLDKVVLPLFYSDTAGWRGMMKQSIGHIGYYFNSQRMMRRYASEAYLK
jgi:glycogen phosphorylase